MRNFLLHNFKWDVYYTSLMPLPLPCHADDENDSTNNCEHMWCGTTMRCDATVAMSAPLFVRHKPKFCTSQSIIEVLYLSWLLLLLQQLGRYSSLVYSFVHSTLLLLSLCSTLPLLLLLLCIETVNQQQESVHNNIVIISDMVRLKINLLAGKSFLIRSIVMMVLMLPLSLSSILRTKTYTTPTVWKTLVMVDWCISSHLIRQTDSKQISPTDRQIATYNHSHRSTTWFVKGWLVK